MQSQKKLNQREEDVIGASVGSDGLSLLSILLLGTNDDALDNGAPNSELITCQL
jgi:hypothetical protein